MPSLGDEACEVMDAYVTVRYYLKDICDERDLADSGMTFDDMVHLMISEDGVMGLAENVDGEVISIERAPDASAPELPL